MRLIDIDDYAASNVTGRTAVLKALEKWEKEHPITELTIPYGEWEVIVKKKENF